MEFEPTEPPGRANRKLLLHLAQVKRLRELGYTIKQIRQAFCQAGVVIGWGTVQREVARLNKSPPRATTGTLQATQKASQPSQPSVAPTLSGTDQPQRVDVAAFFATAVDNPLINRKRGQKP